MSTDKPVISFQVITDTHVTIDSEHVHNVNFDRSLKDIIQHADNSCGIMHAGDITDHGHPEEYMELHRIIAENKEGLPNIRFTLGNHDVGLGDWQARSSLYFKNCGTNSPYHDHWIDGYHFIFLGTEKGLRLHCDLSPVQLQWLEEKLAEQASAHQPIFLFLHQPLLNTVAGSMEEQEWYGVVQDEELRQILSRYPQAILFTGHTHWELEAKAIMFEGGDHMATCFNAASTAYLWTDEDEHKDGSQGFYVDVYEDRVLVKGRDFAEGKWIEAAQFVVPLKTS
ncbi:metallophosphoesterase family protein [Paenibacillus sp. GCM10012307]|uniref:Metallophosphoesterase n=1 Tax=Paenibacillus roseus TaxID=2798579 RepID=A0A934J5M4_9BACL|nr:metallophosphoesterase [Paenibacillus roseus]MBJ6362149.1 metallophosphoesterase [Paenibacillus roseus]